MFTLSEYDFFSYKEKYNTLILVINVSTVINDLLINIHMVQG